MSDYQDRDYEDVCIICRRGESKAGRMFHLPGNITVCDDCFAFASAADDTYIFVISILII